MLVKIIVIWFQKHEIRRNVGGKNHRNRLPTHPTPRLWSSRAKGVDIDSWGLSKDWGSRTQVCMRIISELSFHTSDFGWLTPSCSPIDPQNKSMKIMTSSCLVVLGRFLFLNKSKAYSFCPSHSFTRFLFTTSLALPETVLKMSLWS